MIFCKKIYLNVDFVNFHTPKAYFTRRSRISLHNACVMLYSCDSRDILYINPQHLKGFPYSKQVQTSRLCFDLNGRWEQKCQRAETALAYAGFLSCRYTARWEGRVKNMSLTSVRLLFLQLNCFAVK